MDYLSGLMEERETIATAIEAYATKAEERGSDLTDAETTEVKALQTRAVSIDDRLSTFADAQAANRKYADLTGRITRTAEKRTAEQHESTEATPSLGEAFVTSDEFRAYSGHGRSGVVEGEFRASPIMLADLPGLPRTRILQPQPTVPYPLFGLIDTQALSTNAFDYVVETFTDNSAVVAEGAPKPESDYLQTLVPGVLDTIAHWVTISRQALEDDGRVRSIIDGKLTNGVLKKQHASIMAALIAATLPTATVPTATSNLLAAIRKGVGTVEAAGFNPNAVLLNPADWATLDVTLLNETRNGAVITQSFWGLTPVADNSQPAGTATVGDFQNGATLFRRSGVQVFATDSHASLFVSNLIVILGEARSKAVVTNTAAFAECSVV
jgi:hypothetical protein